MLKGLTRKFLWKTNEANTIVIKADGESEDESFGDKKKGYLNGVFSGVNGLAQRGE